MKNINYIANSESADLEGTSAELRHKKIMDIYKPRSLLIEYFHGKKSIISRIYED